MSSSETTDPTIEQLEAQVRLKQRRITEEKVARFALAEDQHSAIHEAVEGAEEDLPRDVLSPESWRGAQGRDRYFRSPAPLPLEGGPPFRRGVWVGKPTQRASRTSPGPHSGVGSQALARPLWRGRLLMVLEGVALVGFVAILGLSYLRLQALNREAREVQRAALARMALSPTAGLVGDSPARGSATRAEGLALDAMTSPTAPAVQMPGQGAPAEATGSVKTVAPTPTWPEARSIPTHGSTSLAQAPVEAELPGITMAGPTIEAALGTVPIVPTGVVQQADRGAVSSIRVEDGLAERTPGFPTRLVIAALAIDAPVVEGDSEEDLKSGVGYRSGSALPGQAGNVVLSAHNDIHGAIFRDLHKLVAGDQVDIYAEDRVYSYRVDAVEIVLPDRVDVLEPTHEAVVTLITCYPYLVDTHRVVVRASLIR